jgi:hypothetical protein
MEVKVEDLEFGELINLFQSAQEFIEFLKTEEETEVEKRSK